MTTEENTTTILNGLSGLFEDIINYLSTAYSSPKDFSIHINDYINKHLGNFIQNIEVTNTSNPTIMHYVLKLLKELCHFYCNETEMLCKTFQLRNKTQDEVQKFGLDGFSLPLQSTSSMTSSTQNLISTIT
jgi:hypothetical protein